METCRRGWRRFGSVAMRARCFIYAAPRNVLKGYLASPGREKPGYVGLDRYLPSALLIDVVRLPIQLTFCICLRRLLQVPRTASYPSFSPFTRFPYIGIWQTRSQTQKRYVD